jgi:hypothetical protein
VARTLLAELDFEAVGEEGEEVRNQRFKKPLKLRQPLSIEKCVLFIAPSKDITCLSK